MKLETKVGSATGIAVFATFAACQIDPVLTIIATVIAGYIGWHVGCMLSPDEPVKGENKHRNYEDF